MSAAITAALAASSASLAASNAARNSREIRECIAVNGKKYCEEPESTMTARDGGMLLLGIILAVLYIVWLIDYSLASYRGGLVLLGGLLGPPAVIGLLMVLFG
jgi:hypothetical protein